MEEAHVGSWKERVTQVDGWSGPGVPAIGGHARCILQGRGQKEPDLIHVLSLDAHYTALVKPGSASNRVRGPLSNESHESIQSRLLVHPA